MRVLIDESCDCIITKVLHEAGHDVLSVLECCPGAKDTEVISIAVNESRLLVTEDKDFGQLVYASGAGHCGVVLLRYPFPLSAAIAEQLVRLLAEHGQSISDGFVVLQPGKARILKPPKPNY